MEMTDCQATTWLSEAQDLVETLRRLAVNFQQAGARLKSRSRALRGEQRGGESAAALSHLVRQHSATVRNRNSCLRLLKSLRALMDVILGIEPAAAAAEDSWSDDSDHNEANDEAGQVKAEPSVRKTVCVRLGRVRREVALLATRSARLAADESAEERGGGGGLTAAAAVAVVPCTPGRNCCVTSRRHCQRRRAGPRRSATRHRCDRSATSWASFVDLK
eukprot:COSAG01_NODE_1052_length_11920_cov_6.553760_6_plen_219_part_00